MITRGLLCVSPKNPLSQKEAKALVGSASPSRVIDIDSCPIAVEDLPVRGTWFFDSKNPVFGRERAICAIGVFDGVHLGHRRVLARAKREAQKQHARLYVITFAPRPVCVLFPNEHCVDLMGRDLKYRILFDEGADAIGEFLFTPEFAGISYADFVEKVLEKLCELKGIAVGSNFSLGAGGAGTVEKLSALGKNKGFDVFGVDLMDKRGEPVSSSRIRTLLSFGKVEEAAELLGRPHITEGTVVHGRGEGKSFGFPTANVLVDKGFCLPQEGVYGGFLLDDARRQAWSAAINVGDPKSFTKSQKSGSVLEASLVGFSGNLYEKHVRVLFIRYLRPQIKFDSRKELIRTIQENVLWVSQSFGSSTFCIPA